MFVYTFCTEGPGDGPRAEKLIHALNLKTVNHWQVENPMGYFLSVFTVETDALLEDLRDRMAALILRDTAACLAGEDYRLLPFVDLHQCAQTLNRGIKPKWPYDDPASED
jgi:hypothetical protein